METQITLKQTELQNFNSSVHDEALIEKVQRLEDDKQASRQANQSNQSRSQVSEEQIPEHFYDSDIVSVCEKDFLSDNEPPKDIIQERKLLYKEKLLHVYKTIIRVGNGIDKPARYDRTQIRHRLVQQEIVKKYLKQDKENKSKKTGRQVDEQAQTLLGESKLEAQTVTQGISSLKKEITQESVCLNISTLPPYCNTSYLQNTLIREYNIGNSFEQIQRLVTSMKRGQIAFFQLQYLEISKKCSIKIKTKTQIHLIQAIDWTTVIDLDGDKKLLKYVLIKGSGPFRVALYDKISFSYSFSKGSIIVNQFNRAKVTLQKGFIEQLPKVVWRVLTSMKNGQSVQLQIKDQDLKQYESQQSYAQLAVIYKQRSKLYPDNNQNSWFLKITITDLTKVDDIHLDGRVLKQTIVRGVSTAKPQSSSLVYYSLKFLNNQEKEIKKDECFDSDWWEDFVQLQKLQGIRKNYLDDYSVSKLLKKVIKRMKPAEIALVECRDKLLFQYGQDYEQMKQLLQFTETPDRIKIMVRVYNFTEPKTAFNMQLDQKIIESKRKKQIALKLLSQNRIQKALKTFQNIVSFYSSQKINQQAYDHKVSALMNAILCYMKLGKYPQIIQLCNQILLKPRHGHQAKDIKIMGPGHSKMQNSIPLKDQNSPLSKEQNSQLSKDQKQISKNLAYKQEGIMLDGDSRRIAEDLIQNKNIIDKCLIRKAFALVEMGECGQALSCLQRISGGMNGSEQVQKLKKQAKIGKSKYEQKSKRIFKSMFG